MLEQWSTGLLDVTSDYEILSVASLFCGGGVFFLAPNTAISIFNGKASLLSGITQPLHRSAKGLCSEKDTLLCINTCLLLSFPPILLYWRYSPPRLPLSSSPPVCLTQLSQERAEGEVPDRGELHVRLLRLEPVLLVCDLTGGEGGEGQRVSCADPQRSSNEMTVKDFDSTPSLALNSSHPPSIPPPSSLTLCLSTCSSSSPHLSFRPRRRLYYS